MDFLDILIERRKENEKYFRKPEEYAKLIKLKSEKILGCVEVYLFGSIVRKDWTLSSDIDILVVSEKEINPEDKGKIKVELLKSVDFFAPFEIHLVSQELFEKWYKKFIKDEYIKI